MAAGCGGEGVVVRRRRAVRLPMIAGRLKTSVRDGIYFSSFFFLVSSLRSL